MNFLELTEKRFSCRAYADRSVEKEKIQYLLECARMAPSAVNRQPWRFHVLPTGNETRLLWDTYNREWFRSAPACIVVVLLHDEEWVRADGKPHGNIDAAIAAEHICLAAAEQGLASCWVCNFDEQACRKALNLPESEEPVVIIPIGYPAEAPKEKSRKEYDKITRTHTN